MGRRTRVCLQTSVAKLRYERSCISSFISSTSTGLGRVGVRACPCRSIMGTVMG